jgi:hypothetical protein
MGGPMGKAAPTPNWERALVGKNFSPLRVVTGDGRKNQFRTEATRSLTWAECCRSSRACPAVTEARSQS